MSAQSPESQKPPRTIVSLLAMLRNTRARPIETPCLLTTVEVLIQKISRITVGSSLFLCLRDVQVINKSEVMIEFMKYRTLHACTQDPSASALLMFLGWLAGWKKLYPNKQNQTDGFTLVRFNIQANFRILGKGFRREKQILSQCWVDHG